MKFELEPDNKNCPDEILLNDIVETARKLKKNSLTKDDYDKHGRFCAATMQKRFSSWNKALGKAGLNLQHRNDIPHEEFLSDLKSVASKLGIITITKNEYDVHGRFSGETIRRAFKSWANALSKAGLKPTNFKPPLTDEELFDNIASIWEQVGRQPKWIDFHPPLSRCVQAVYVRRFGSWRKALEKFVEYANAEEDKPEKNYTVNTIKQEEPPTTQIKTHKTSRQPSWRLRFLVMRQDNFKCKNCGWSPATGTGRTLEIDHITPYSKGGETVMKNLQTLCTVCNGGKSNLE